MKKHKQDTPDQVSVKKSFNDAIEKQSTKNLYSDRSNILNNLNHDNQRKGIIFVAQNLRIKKLNNAMKYSLQDNFYKPSKKNWTFKNINILQKINSFQNEINYNTKYHILNQVNHQNAYKLHVIQNTIVHNKKAIADMYKDQKIVDIAKLLLKMKYNSQNKYQN